MVLEYEIVRVGRSGGRPFEPRCVWVTGMSFETSRIKSNARRRWDDHLLYLLTSFSAVGGNYPTLGFLDYRMASRTSQRLRPGTSMANRISPESGDWLARLPTIKTGRVHWPECILRDEVSVPPRVFFFNFGQSIKGGLPYRPSAAQG